MDNAVEEHREALEALAEHGQTELAKDAAAVLEEIREEPPTP